MSLQRRNEVDLSIARMGREAEAGHQPQRPVVRPIAMPRCHSLTPTTSSSTFSGKHRSVECSEAQIQGHRCFPLLENRLEVRFWATTLKLENSIIPAVADLIGPRINRKADS